MDEPHISQNKAMTLAAGVHGTATQRPLATITVYSLEAATSAEPHGSQPTLVKKAAGVHGTARLWRHELVKAHGSNSGVISRNRNVSGAVCWPMLVSNEGSWRSYNSQAVET